jgi:hypothetical protein
MDGRATDIRRGQVTVAPRRGWQLYPHGLFFLKVVVLAALVSLRLAFHEWHGTVSAATSRECLYISPVIATLALACFATVLASNWPARQRVAIHAGVLYALAAVGHLLNGHDRLFAPSVAGGRRVPIILLCVHLMFPAMVNELFAESSALTKRDPQATAVITRAMTSWLLLRRFALDVVTIVAFYVPQPWLRVVLLAATLSCYPGIKREVEAALLALVEADAVAERMRKLYGRGLMKAIFFCSLVYQLLGSAYAMRWVSQDTLVSR